jgi:hypothetical protein
MQDQKMITPEGIITEICESLRKLQEGEDNMKDMKMTDIGVGFLVMEKIELWREIETKSRHMAGAYEEVFNRHLSLLEAADAE